MKRPAGKLLIIGIVVILASVLYFLIRSIFCAV